MEAVYDQQAFSVKCTNLTQKASIINTYRFDSGTTFPPPNCSNFGLNCVGGTWKLTEFTVTANELKNLDLLCIGDSITSGALATKAGRDFVSIIASRFPGYRISRYSGGCDGAFHYAQTTVLNEIVSLAPKNAMILLGINDYNNGRSTAQLESNYGTIVTALKNAGINVIHAGLLPNNSVDTRIFNNWVKVSYSSDVQFDLFSPLAALGVNVLSGGSYGINSSFSDDGLHPNDTGSLVLGDVLTFELIRNGILSPSYPLCQTI
jgi:lysophospholipase L1-like esterase